MNPEDNNPLANPGVPDFGVPNSQLNIPGNDLSMTDSLSMAGDSLTAAGMAAAPTAAGPIDFNQIDTVTPEGAASLTTVEEPLVPAAPVPGSIGSVTSVPAAEPLANPFAAESTTAGGPVPAPEVQPQAAPYNPFAQTSETTTAGQPSPAPAAATNPVPTPESANPFMTPAQNTVNPAFQPAPAPIKTKAKSAHSMNPLTAILAVVCALLLISTIVFAALYINAKNNPKVVYVPTVAGGESDSQIKFLACARNEEMNWLINDAYVVPAARTLTMNYSDDKLSALTDEYQITFANDIDAIAGRDIFSNTTAASLPVPSEVEYAVEGNILGVKIDPAEAASDYLYGSIADIPSTSMVDVQSSLEANGFVCTVE